MVMNRMKNIIGASLLALFVWGFASCQHEEENLTFGNKCIKRSLGPNVWSTQMEFAYAMAIRPELGNLVEAKVEASIPGAEGTLLENQSWYAKLDGMDTAIVVGEPCVTEGTLSTVKFNRDTCASTLRYYYTIPEEAKGKEVSFTFSAKASNGETVSMQMGPYTVASMDMKLDIALGGPVSYISIEDLTRAGDLIRSRIKVKSMSFMRGRTFLNKFVIIDEAQNLSPKQMKTLITRAGPGTKIVCLGNIAQIDTPYLTEGSSGLTYVVDRFKGWEHAGHVTLQRGERSRLADFASESL